MAEKKIKPEEMNFNNVDIKCDNCTIYNNKTGMNVCFCAVPGFCPGLTKSIEKKEELYKRQVVKHIRNLYNFRITYQENNNIKIKLILKDKEKYIKSIEWFTELNKDSINYGKKYINIDENIDEEFKIKIERDDKDSKEKMYLLNIKRNKNILISKYISTRSITWR